MAQYFKDIRTKGVEVLSEMSTELGKLAATEVAESSKAFTAACKEIEHGEVRLLTTVTKSQPLITVSS